ncbi:hypothetical protein [Paraburkholderia sp. BCC1886]|uniref:hypothetical protein n=1 Tax=Paraburkholderia sp. BCC1886 TaxID=2562670 RepID=UPI00118440AF|nr:hypothetical protein [Paraburkholderia sp. BCC1886]
MKAALLDLTRANRAGVVPGLVGLMLAAVVLLGTVRYLDALKEQGAALDERESAIASEEGRRELISRAHRQPDNPRAAQLMAQQKYATEPARDLIEGGWRPNIAFLTMEIATASREINMVFETRSVQEALSYSDWLEAQAGTERVVIKRQAEKPGPPVKSVETTLQITWRAAGPRDAAAKPAGASATAVSAPASAIVPASTSGRP